MVTVVTGEIVALFQISMSGVVKDDVALIGFEFDLFRRFRMSKIIYPMTETARHRTVDMTGYTVFTNAPRVDTLVAAGRLIAVMTFPAIHGIEVFALRFIIMVAVDTGDIVYIGRCMVEVIENDRSALGGKSNLERFFYWFKAITPYGHNDKNQQ